MIEKFEKKVWLSSPTMHGEELEYMKLAYDTNWMSTLGENIDEVAKTACEVTGSKYAVPLSCGTAALHMAAKLAGVRLGDRVFCSDMTFSATLNPILYEKGIPVFIDTERDTWNMCPESLEKAFKKYPEVKVVIFAQLYGTPAKIDELREVCNRHGAIMIEDAAESLGATYKGQQTGTFGKFNAISFNGNGGMLLTDDKDAFDLAWKWANQARESAAWYEHKDVGYNYRMSNVIAGVVRGQFPYLEAHIAQKKSIYERYKEGFKDLPVTMNPFDAKNSVPNYWLSCLLIDKDAMCRQERGEYKAEYWTEKSKSCPTEIMETLSACNAESRPIWKPMHMQPLYHHNDFISVEGDVGADIFNRGLCLPSDNKMTPEIQDKVIEIVKSCFD